MSAFDVNRRWFLATIGGAAVAMGFLSTGAQADPVFGSVPPGGYNPTLWYEIRGDGRILVHVTRAEMGQHIGTALARIVAEELEANWDHVEIVHVNTDPRWGIMFTGASWSVHKSFDQLSPGRRCRSHRPPGSWRKDARGTNRGLYRPQQRGPARLTRSAARSSS